MARMPGRGDLLGAMDLLRRTDLENEAESNVLMAYVRARHCLETRKLKAAHCLPEPQK